MLGRNCRFLQGADTDPIAVARIRTALDEGRAIATVIRNYRRDGSPFWNQVVISPVVDEAGRVTHHIGIQADVTDRVAADRARDLELDLADEATARLDLLARISDELAQHLDYDDAVDALGDIAIPALATWGFVAITDDRGRFSRVHLVAGDPDDRETARALANEDISWLSRAPKITEALTSSPGFVATPYAIDVAGLPGRTTPVQLDLLRRLGLGSAWSSRCARATASSACSPSWPSTGSAPTPWSRPRTWGAAPVSRSTTSGSSSPSGPPR